MKTHDIRRSQHKHAKPKLPWQQLHNLTLTRMGQPFMQGLNLPTHLQAHTMIKHQHQGLDGAYFLPHQPMQKRTFLINQRFSMKYTTNPCESERTQPLKPGHKWYKQDETTKRKGAPPP